MRGSRPNRVLPNRVRLNRVLLGLTGLILFGTGLLVLVPALDLPRRWGFTMPDGWPYTTPDDVLLSDSARTRYRDDDWWWPVVIAALAVIVLIALWWLLAQLRSHRLRQTRVVDGVLLRGRALEDVVTAEAEDLDGVARAHVSLTGSPDAPTARIVLALAPHARPRATLAALHGTVLARAARSAGLAQLPAEVRLRAVSHRASRVT